MEIADNFFHCSLHLRKVSGDNKRTTETVHKSNFYVCTFHCYISCNNNSLPGSETDKTKRFSRMVFSFVNSDVKPQILVNRSLGSADNMGKADFFSGNAHAGHAETFPFQMLIVIMEQLFQQFFLCYTGHVLHFLSLCDVTDYISERISEKGYDFCQS